MKYLAGLFTLLALCWYVPAAIWGVQITEAISRFQAGESVDFAALSDGPAPLAFLRKRGQVSDGFSTTELNDERRVFLIETFDLAEMLNADEAMPPAELRELYAKARAAQHLHAHCRDVIATLGSLCDVQKVEANLTYDGRVRVSGQLNYVPSYELGDRSGIENGGLISASAILDSTLGGSPNIRAVYTKGLSICDELRARFGNCFIRSIEHVFPVEGILRVQPARGYFVVFADETVVNKASLQAVLDEIVAAQDSPRTVEQTEMPLSTIGDVDR